MRSQWNILLADLHDSTISIKSENISQISMYSVLKRVFTVPWVKDHFQSFQFFLSVRDIFSMLQGIHAWTTYMRGSSTLYCLIFCDDSWRDQQTNIWAAEAPLGRRAGRFSSQLFIYVSELIWLVENGNGRRWSYQIVCYSITEHVLTLFVIELV